MSQVYSSTHFDDTLLQFDAFAMRPFLLPHIGNKIPESDGVLFSMESHYTDPAFFEYQYDKENLKTNAPELFYNTKEDGLTNDFKAYLNTRQIITDSHSNDRKLAKGKSVYRKLSSVVREGLKLPDNDRGSALDHVAIYNYFQRPSYSPGASIKLCDKDVTVAHEALEHILNTVKISKILFTSSKAYDSFIRIDNSNQACLQRGIKIFRGTHPRVWGQTCAYEKGITWKQWVINRLASVA